MNRLPLSAVMLLGWAVLAIAAPWFGLHPDRIDLTHILTPPGRAALLGFDDLGRPLWDRLVMGARSSLLVAVEVVSFSALIGVALGVSSAYVGGAWDRFAMRVIDIVLAFPGILLAIALAGVLGPGLENVVIALCTVGWVGYARLARGQVLALKHRDHVLAARALGAGRVRIMTRHLLPLIAAPLIVEASFSIAAVVLAEAGLEEVDAAGKPFDPNLHEAVSQEPSAEVAEGQVLRQLRKGYKLRERLLREGPAKFATREKMALLMDAQSMIWLHRELWSCPASSLAE